MKNVKSILGNYIYIMNNYQKAYNTKKVLFNVNNTVRWIILGVDFFKYTKNRWL